MYPSASGHCLMASEFYSGQPVNNFHVQPVLRASGEKSKVTTMAEKGHDCKHSPFFFTITLVVFFLQNYTRRFFFFKITLAVFFFRITRDVFFRDDAIINYTRRFFNAILHATFFQCNNYTRRLFQQLHSPFF
jgi:hypothetical protein